LIRLPDRPFTLEGLHRRVIDLRLSLTRVLILAEDYRAAERQLNTWLDASRDPTERFGLLQRLAYCHRAQGDESLANEVLARALVLRPDDVTLNNDVAYGWVDRGIRLDEAEPMIRYALWRSPRQGAYLDTYGWLLYKKGDFAEAKKWLLRASRTRTGGDPVVLDHLGDTCWRIGESDEAVKHWTAAVEAARVRSNEGAVISADERRVGNKTQEKIDAARAGRPPAVAPLAAVPSGDDEPEDEEGAGE
jgi:Tfp pilus assembly protein PilF